MKLSSFIFFNFFSLLINSLPVSSFVHPKSITSKTDYVDSINIDTNIGLSQPFELSQVAVIPSDSNWNINGLALISLGKFRSNFTTTNIIFDQYSNAIGLPEDIFSHIISYLQTATHMTCNNTAYKPTCHYSGMLSSLPNITISVHQQQINIPPQIYIKDYQVYASEVVNAIVQLNFKRVTLFSTTPIIILDKNILSYYTVAFDKSPDPQIIFYESISIEPHTTSSQEDHSNFNLWIYIISACVGLDLLVCVLCCCFCKKKKRKVQDTVSSTPIDQESSDNNTSLLLLANQQFSSEPSTMTDVTDLEAVNQGVNRDRSNRHWISYYSYRYQY